MQKSLLSVLFIFSIFITSAQFKTIAEGPTFEEPESGFAKILQLQNGNTVFFHITSKGEINCRLYNSKHAEIAMTSIDPAYGKLKQGAVEETFELNGDVVLLISEIDGKRPVLYRLIIDGKTGRLKDEKTIAELEKASFGMGYAVAFGNVPVPQFYTRKDPNGSNYAIVLFNSFESDRAKRIEVVLFNGDHKEINRSYVSSPGDRYKYLEYIDMAVTANDRVTIMAYGYNTENSGGKESELLLATLETGAKKVAFNKLKLPLNIRVQYGNCRYNPVTKKIMFIAAANGKGSNYTPYLAIVDPETKKMEKSIEIVSTESMNMLLLEKYKKSSYDGMIQNMVVNEDGSFSVVREEMEVKSNTSRYGTTYRTFLKNMVISTYDIDGKVISSYFIPKEQRLLDQRLFPFYHSRREGSAATLVGGNQFKSFAYIPGTKKNYVLFNDLQENIEREQKGKSPETVSTVSDCDGFYFTLEGDDLTPERKYIFGEPAGKKEHNLCLFTISDYDKKTNTYITLRLKNTGRSKGVNLIWMQP